MKLLNALIVAVIIFLAYKYLGWIFGTIVVAAVIAYLIHQNIPVFYRAKARKLFAEGDYKGAQRTYKKVFDMGRANAESRMELSYMLLRTGDVEEAEQLVNELLSYKLKPELRGRAVIQRCMCYYKRGNLEEAIEDAKELYNDGYRSIMHYGMLGFFKILTDPMSKDTFDFCKEAYEYADDDRDIRDNMIICYYNHGEYEKAKEISDAVIENGSKLVESWYHAAQIDYKLRDYGAAKEKLSHIKDCNRSFMTTIPEDDVEKLKRMVDAKLGARI